MFNFELIVIEHKINLLVYIVVCACPQFYNNNIHQGGYFQRASVKCFMILIYSTCIL